MKKNFFDWVGTTYRNLFGHKIALNEGDIKALEPIYGYLKSSCNEMKSELHRLELERNRIPERFFQYLYDKLEKQEKLMDDIKNNVENNNKLNVTNCYYLCKEFNDCREYFMQKCLWQVEDLFFDSLFRMLSDVCIKEVTERVSIEREIDNIIRHINILEGEERFMPYLGDDHYAIAVQNAENAAEIIGVAGSLSDTGDSDVDN